MDLWEARDISLRTSDSVKIRSGWRTIDSVLVSLRRLRRAVIGSLNTLANLPRVGMYGALDHRPHGEHQMSYPNKPH